jgi:PAS domain S-box-containing protein
MLDGKKNGIAKILIVEDQHIIAEDLGFSLENLGYVVKGKVSDGQAAVDLAEKLRPDLILMDIKLQGDVDGIGAAEQIRKRLDIPVIYLTGYSERDVLERAKKTEPYGYIGKPVSLTELRNTIETGIYKHKVDKSVRQSETRRAKAEELAGLHSWEWDIQEGNLIWSAESYRAFGLDSGNPKLNFNSFINAVHKEDRNFVEIALQDALKGERSYDIEFRILRPDGTERILHSRGEVERNPDGLPIRMMGMALDVTDRKRIEAEKDLILNMSHDLICVAGMDGYFKYVNKSWERVLGYAEEELLSRPFLDFIHPEDHEKNDHEVLKLKSGQITVDFENRYIHQDGSIKYISWTAAPIPQDGLMYCVGRDITDRKEAQNQLSKSLAEKEFLLQEIHHRVKNNLAVILSLLRIQSHHFNNPEFSRILEETQNRIRFLALGHELLYSSQTLSEIKANQYVGSLLTHLAGSHSMVGKRISVDKDVEEFGLPVDTVVPLGFILTELVSNCYRHAFAKRRDGKIAVSITRIPGDHLELVVKDNGIGLTEDIDLSKPKSMGYHLIQIFVKQLRGKLEVTGQNGTEVRISFPSN